MKIMEMVRFFLLSVHCAFALTLLVIAQDQSGSIVFDAFEFFRSQIHTILFTYSYIYVGLGRLYLKLSYQSYSA